MAAPPEAPREAPAAPLVDTHAHLNDRRFAHDLDAVLARAAEHGVGAMVVAGYNLATSRRAVELAQRHDSLWAAVGIHPHDATSAGRAALAELGRLAGQPKVVAIGECGLDYYRNLSPRAAQVTAFTHQLRLAARCGLPVVVHSRDAMAETLRILAAEQTPAGGVMHCFAGTTDEALHAIDLGFYISAAGSITYPRNTALAGVFAAIPTDRIVVETDCPWLSPEGRRGQRNEPAYLPLVAGALARLRNQSLGAIATLTSRNATALFRTAALATWPVKHAA
ncbi:MAG: TatD family hydrolase [Chloroflexi bacterium]|nr:TatD family hydrolase [Chloroflexota bacterium]